MPLPLPRRLIKHSRQLLVVLSTSLFLCWQPLMAQDSSLYYVPDPTFSALSKKGTPKDIMRGGGKRGCLNLAMTDVTRGLKAIVPPDENGGLSAASRPTFWIYTPYEADQSIVAVLSIRKADSFTAQPIQKVQLQLPNRAGLMKVQLPKSITEADLLAWTLTVVCDAENPARNPFVSGLVMVKPDDELLKRVADLSKKEQVVQFMRSGYWYDALALVAPDGDGAVQQLMESVGWKAKR
jgi:Domain of Unknown Function (DUF928)